MQSRYLTFVRADDAESAVFLVRELLTEGKTMDELPAGLCELAKKRGPGAAETEA
jgi:hypothetical protein